MTLHLANLEAPMLTADAVVTDNILTARLHGTADTESRPGLEG